MSTEPRAPITPTSGHDYEAVFEEFWKPLVTLPDGSLNTDQIKRELADYHFMLHEVPRVYCEVSGGRISKPNTMAFEVINQFQDLLQRTVDEATAEAQPGWWAEEKRLIDERLAYFEAAKKLRGAIRVALDEWHKFTDHLDDSIAVHDVLEIAYQDTAGTVY